MKLYSTFGNHMHWVDMQWLWGYHVLPGSVRDMIRLCREAGVKGNVNFDGVGYEKLAAEDPEAFAELREAVRSGMVEVVGASYGQPYGQFHGGESNVRQRLYGARTVRRLFGLWPQTFWEEEFDCFPQLPQMLARCGFRYGSLFFQWTWHTPEVPFEEAPVVRWESPDGSGLLAATRNRLNLHQWPEDMDLTFRELAESPPAEAGGPPLVLQWLELMPSPDWMCRSEVILPKLRELLSDPRFEVVPVTLGEYLSLFGGSAGGSAVPAEVSPGVSPGAEIHRRRGAYLPHWTTAGGTYAVTFRLADALPIEVQREIRAEREYLRAERESSGVPLAAADFEYERRHQERIESLLEEGLGSCLLAEPENAEIVTNALRFFDGERYDLAAFCVMPNHVHVVVQPKEGHSLPDILHSWKSFTAHQINKRLGTDGPIWQSEYYDHLIRNKKDIERQVEFVLQNPLKAGLSDWPYVFQSHGRDGHANLGRDAQATGVPVRRYHPDQTWHGLTLGKNGDRMRRRSHSVERRILEAEALSATLGLFGRPYAQWDVYPTWELEEAWRELLQAQHHDNDECEGLCGRVGLASYDRAETLARQVFDLQANLLCQRLAAEPGLFLLNPLPWPRTVTDAALGRPVGLGETILGAYGWLAVPRHDLEPLPDPSGRPELPGLAPDFPRIVRPEPSDPDMLNEEIRWQSSQVAGAHELKVTGSVLDQDMPPGYGGAWRLPFQPTFALAHVFSDSPYHVDEIHNGSSGRRKYPEGDWMTSPQWFEEVSGAFTALSFVDLVAEDGSGVLIAHDGSLQWFRTEEGVEAVLLTRDPWDEREVETSFEARFLVLPHGPISHADRWRIAQEFRNPVQLHAKVGPPGDVPAAFSPLEVSGGLVATAFFREIEGYAGRGVEGYAGEGMGYPYVLRLVEFDGHGGEAEVRFAATVERAAKTNLLGEVEEWLPVVDGAVRVPYGPHEIVTLMLDLVEGRKQTRDLDAKREVWATVHRT